MWKPITAAAALGAVAAVAGCGSGAGSSQAAATATHATCPAGTHNQSNDPQSSALNCVGNTPTVPRPVRLATRQMCDAATKIYDQVSSAVTIQNLLSRAPRWRAELKEAGNIPKQQGVAAGPNTPNKLTVKFSEADLVIRLADQQATDPAQMKVRKVRNEMNVAAFLLKGAMNLCPRG